jgi:CheY-like chemotaxis protein
VLLDLTMPKLDGAKALPQLRAVRADVPIILASGYDEHEVTKRLEGLGFAGFAQKPFQQESLVAMIQQVCQTPK